MRATRFYNLIGKAGEQLGLYSTYRPVPLNLQTLLKFGQTAPTSKSFEFLKNELPVRMAAMLKEVRLLPEAFTDAKEIKHTIELYEEIFKTLMKYQSCDVTDSSAISNFTEDLRTMCERHIDVISHVATGIEIMKRGGEDLSAERTHRLHYFLNRFYICRIGIRMLSRQHVLLYDSWMDVNSRHVGVIDPYCSPVQQLVIAYAHARRMCISVYGRAPGCKILAFDRLDTKQQSCSGMRRTQRISRTVQESSVSVTVDENGNVDGPFDSIMFPYIRAANCADLDIRGQAYVDFCYIPGHLFHILFELMKNSMRAVVEHYASDSALPKICVTIVRAPEDVTFKLSDLGGGMPRRLAEQAFNYTFTTASLSKPSNTSRDDGTETNLDPSADPEKATFSPLAGRGHGLPLSRLYARYLNGDLRLISVEGYGSTACLYLKRLPHHAHELIPVFNRTSQSVYESEPMDCDWISSPIPPLAACR